MFSNPVKSRLPSKLRSQPLRRLTREVEPNDNL
jgi:hypothetical protein